MYSDIQGRLIVNVPSQIFIQNLRKQKEIYPQIFIKSARKQKEIFYKQCFRKVKRSNSLSKFFFLSFAVYTPTRFLLPPEVSESGECHRCVAACVDSVLFQPSNRKSFLNNDCTYTMQRGRVRERQKEGGIQILIYVSTYIYQYVKD